MFISVKCRQLKETSLGAQPSNPHCGPSSKLCTLVVGYVEVALFYMLINSNFCSVLSPCC